LQLSAGVKVEHLNSTISFFAPSGKLIFVFGLPNIRFAPTKKTVSLRPRLEWDAAHSEIFVITPENATFPATAHFGLSPSVPLELAQSLFYGEDEEIEEGEKVSKAKGKFGVCFFL